MPDYSHLAAPIADTRYVQAAHYLRNCNTLVEVGGHRLHQFMGKDVWRQFHNIDPAAEISYNSGIQTHCMPVTEFDFGLVLPTREEKRGLCLLGMELYDHTYGVGSGIASIEHIANNIHLFDTIVIEFVESNPIARDQSLVLLSAGHESSRMRRTIRFMSQWINDDKYPQHNTSFRKPREFWVLEKS